ncbi:MAG: iron chelate uptake ABC transporter family permease subunit [Pirellulaceae bacterium]|nr:iron chelate uptake ABC transporter family permease subunit [Pirellulaceae bacterium]
MPFDLPEVIAPTLSEQIRSIRRRRRWQTVALVALLLVACVCSLMIGPVAISVPELGQIAWARISGGQYAGTPTNALVVEQLRLPRMLMGALIGAALAVAGAAMQGLFRNPLADPGLIGVSAGAALGAVTVIVLGERFVPSLPAAFAPYFLAVAAFAGSLLATLLIYKLSLHDGQPVVATLLLAGVAINALAGSLTAFLTFLATDQQVRDVTFWMLGSLGATTWPKTGIVAVCVIAGLLMMPVSSRALNALLLGESEAAHLGFDVRRTKAIVVALSALMVGAGVAFAGVIGFIGLVVPHVVRLAAGPDHRFLLPASALLGATLMVAADLAARTLVTPAELPIGILTAVFGAPFFLWLLLRAKSGWQP